MASYKIIIQHRNHKTATFMIIANSRVNAKFQLERHADYIEHLQNEPSPIAAASMQAQLGQTPIKLGLISVKNRIGGEG